LPAKAAVDADALPSSRRDPVYIGSAVGLGVHAVAGDAVAAIVVAGTTIGPAQLLSG
jgi:hypothetical protein